eukprot:c4740_g1_i1.p1 GENE.c4740_g1_i1~~c4740_g1_i1.p1  ORF type:complete len:381 (+),score=76.89 c4740_g1_i1:112-1143(+)
MDDAITASAMTSTGAAGGEAAIIADEESAFVRDGQVMEAERQRAALSRLRQRALLDPIVLQYFNSQDTAEFEAALTHIGDDDVFVSLGIDPLASLVRRGIEISMGLQGRERELMSVLLGVVVGDDKAMSRSKLELAFSDLLARLEDLATDLPYVADITGRFLSRAVVDEVLSPSFLTQAAGELGENDTQAPQAIRLARDLLKMNHAGLHIEHQWGFKLEYEEVDSLKRKIQQLLDEYLDSADAAEAERCVRELRSDHFHHEVVKRALITGFERGFRARGLVSKLLGSLARSGCVSSDQMALGFRRVLERIEDIKLDVPAAYPAFVQDTCRAIQLGALEPSFCL